MWLVEDKLLMIVNLRNKAFDHLHFGTINVGRCVYTDLLPKVNHYLLCLADIRGEIIVLAPIYKFLKHLSLLPLIIIYLVHPVIISMVQGGQLTTFSGAISDGNKSWISQ